MLRYKKPDSALIAAETLAPDASNQHCRPEAKPGALPQCLYYALGAVSN